jgi:hypothetical protein
LPARRGAASPIRTTLIALDWLQARQAIARARATHDDPRRPLADQSLARGKDADEAKMLQLSGWRCPRHLAGRLFAAVVHGDTVGVEMLRRILGRSTCTWSRPGALWTAYRYLEFYAQP